MVAAVPAPATVTRSTRAAGGAAAVLDASTMLATLPADTCGRRLAAFNRDDAEIERSLMPHSHLDVEQRLHHFRLGLNHLGVGRELDAGGDLLDGLVGELDVGCPHQSVLVRKRGARIVLGH